MPWPMLCSQCLARSWSVSHSRAESSARFRRPEDVRNFSLCRGSTGVRDMLGDPFLNYFALGLLIFVVVVIFYGIIAIHDIPAQIAEKRHHPHRDAIHAAGWVSLFTLH